MCTASSHAATWAAPASASEYTATVRIPIRRAVRATRQAISPRFAISSFENTGLLLGRPGRRALFEERGDAFPTFRRDARIRNALGGGRQQHIIHWRFDYVGKQPLGGGQRRRACRQQVIGDSLDFAIE